MEDRAFSTPTAPAVSESTDTGSVKMMEPSGIKRIESVVGYEREHSKPYSVEHFKLHDYGELSRSPLLDVDSILPKVEVLETYVADNIELRGLEDKPETFKFLINEILEKIGDIEVEDIRHKFFRVMKYVEKNKDIKRQLDIASLKEQLTELEYGN